MARFAISTVLVAALCATATADKKYGGWTDYGMDLSISAYEAVCWYEYYKIYPDGDKNDDIQCGGTAQSMKDQLPANNEDMAKKYFGVFTKQLAMPRIPNEYTSTCGKYLDDANLKESSDESDALNDPNSKSTFIYKGFAYCLMGTLRKRHGAKAIDAVKDERTHTIKDWRMMALDKDNELRARHGAAPFKRLKALDDVAQNWAQKMADECNMYHSANNAPDRQYMGKYTGESIASGGGSFDKFKIPYASVNNWYSEVKAYPFPKSCDDKGACDGRTVGHFTQTVWSGSEYVGYGMAYSDSCKKYFFAGRYYPGGNVGTMYSANVFPPKQ